MSLNPDAPLPLGKEGEDQYHLLTQSLEIGTGFELFFAVSDFWTALREVDRRLSVASIPGNIYKRLVYPKPAELYLLLENLLTQPPPPPEGRYIIAVQSEGAPDELRAGWIQGLILLNEQRNRLIRACPAAIILFGPPLLLLAAQNRAPDLWSVRSSVFMFPRPETGVEPSIQIGVSGAFTDSMAQDLKDGDYYSSLADALEGSGKKSEQRSWANLLNRAAEAWYLHGEPVKAMKALENALAAYHQLHEFQAEAATLQNMAGMLAQQGNVFRAMSLLEDSLKLKERIGDIKGKAFTLDTLAVITARQGDISRAQSLWEESLRLKEQIGDVLGKALTFHNLADMFSQQGDVSHAISLFEKSLNISSQIGDVKGMSNTLQGLGSAIGQQGDLNRAISVLEKALELNEKTGDVHGQATALANMAWMEGKRANNIRQRELHLKAAQLFGNIRAFLDLVIVLGNLSASEEVDSLSHLAQAIWISLRTATPLRDTIELHSFLIQRIGPSDQRAHFAASTALLIARTRGETHPERQSLIQNALSLLTGCAEARGINAEKFEDWIARERLDDPDYFLPAFNRALEEMVGEAGWLFDRGDLVPLDPGSVGG